MEISTALIVKDEISNIKNILPDLKKFSDEIVVVDTGSTDGTVELLKEQEGIKLCFYNWDNNFSNARNETLKYATKDFILWLDADDRLDNNNILKLIKFKAKLDLNKIYFFKLINSVDNTFSYQIRLFPNKKGIKFIYPVHEQLEFDRKNFDISFENIEIIHKGYEDRNVLIKKQKRNIQILSSIENKDFYVFLQLAESYKILQEFKKSEEYFLKSLEDKTIGDKNKEILGFIYVELYKISVLQKKDINKAINFLFASVDFAEYYPVSFYYAGRFYYDNNEIEKAKDFFVKFLKLHKSKKYINPVPLKIQDSCYYFLANIYLKLGDNIKAEKIIRKLLDKFPDNRNYLRLYEKCR